MTDVDDEMGDALAVVLGRVPEGGRIALADGCGSPRATYAVLSALARERGDLCLVTGWLPGPTAGLDLGAFAEVRTVMPGWGLRAGAESGRVRTVPARLSAVPGLLTGPLRPHVLLAALAPDGPGGPGGPGGSGSSDGPGPRPGSEVSWMGGLIAAGVPVAAVIDEGLPRAAAGPVVSPEQLTMLAERADGAHPVPDPAPSATYDAIGAHVAALVAELVDEIGGPVRLQWAPGRLGSAVVAGVIDAGRPVAVDSGLLGDAVVDLDESGLLVGDPVATYLAGTARLGDWASARAATGRAVLHGIEHTHHPGRLADGPPLVAVNTAVEIDLDGQVNVEGTARSLVGGIGGHPDYAGAAARTAGGRSVVALATAHQGRSTRVERLSRPVSTGAHDVDVVVTELGVADLRGLDRPERRAALDRLWPPSVNDSSRG